MATSSINRALPDVFRGSIARKAGLITAGQLKGPSVKRLFQDVYTRSETPITHELRCRGAALLAPAEAVLTGRSAATIRGIDLAKPYDPVEFIVPEEFRFGPIQGIRVRRTTVTHKESRSWQNCRIAKPARIALDLLLRLSPRTHGWVKRLRIGVADLDAFLRSRIIHHKAVKKALFKRRNRGIVLARQALQLADPRAESIPESHLRIVLTHAGFKPVPQYNVRKNGKLLGRLDLALKEAKVAIEYDGRWHNTPAQLAYDRERRRRISAEGWRFVVITAEQLATDYQLVVDLVRAAQKEQLAR